MSSTNEMNQTKSTPTSNFEKFVNLNYLYLFKLLTYIYTNILI